MIFCNVFLQFIPNFYKVFLGNSDESALQALVDFFQKLEDTLKHHKEDLGMQFVGGATKPGAVDYLIWPWIERSRALKIANTSKMIMAWELGIGSVQVIDPYGSPGQGSDLPTCDKSEWWLIDQSKSVVYLIKLVTTSKRI